LGPGQKTRDLTLPAGSWRQWARAAEKQESWCAPLSTHSTNIRGAVRHICEGLPIRQATNDVEGVSIARRMVAQCRDGD